MLYTVCSRSGAQLTFAAVHNLLYEIYKLVIAHVSSVLLLLQRGSTALMLAVYNGHQEAVRILLQAKANRDLRDTVIFELQLIMYSNRVSNNYAFYFMQNVLLITTY